MKKSRSILLLTVIVITSLWAFREWQIYADSTKFGGPSPDVIVGDLPSVRYWGSSGGDSAFSVGTTSCNIGNADLTWLANSNNHPVISQNLYRVNDGRIEHLGQSWLKHGFLALAQSLCGTCQNPGTGTKLGVGCSDPYTAGLNGSHSRLGPKGEVNATTGFFSWPHRSLPQTGVLDGRIRVANADLDPAQNTGARYFAESQYIHPEDAAAGNDDNNASYREAFVSSLGGGNFDVNFDPLGPSTVRQQPAIVAWQAVHSDVQLFYLDIPGDGRVIVGLRTVQDGKGYHTEVAVQNFNSHRSVQSLDINFGAGSITNPGFNDVDYQHEQYSATDWAPSINGSAIEWSTQTFAENQNANAVRWDTIYSFWCDSDVRPSQLTLGMFRPGTPDGIVINLLDKVLPEGTKLPDGVVVAGGMSDLFASDDIYLEMDPSPTKNLLKQKIHLIVQSTSASSTPADFRFRLESKMLGGASGDVIQTIELMNYDTGRFELLDTRPVETSDEIVEVVATGDLSRFVQAGTNEITASATWKSESFIGGGFTWSIDVDEAIWLVTD